MRNNKLGYYQVGLEYFEHKVPALLRATEIGQHPEWNFNKEAFDSVNWKQEPQESLWELYTKRAHQLREKYDYLILGYSGGSDSKNILDVFLQNGIKIDEIVSKFSIKGMGKGYTPTKEELNYDFNAPAEWEFTAKKDFQWLAEHHPEIKLTFYDWFENPNLTLAEDWYKDLPSVYAPAGRILWPKEIAAAAIYWLADECGPISGQVVELEQHPFIGRNPPKDASTIQVNK